MRMLLLVFLIGCTGNAAEPVPVDAFVSSFKDASEHDGPYGTNLEPAQVLSDAGPPIADAGIDASH